MRGPRTRLARGASPRDKSARSVNILAVNSPAGGTGASFLCSRAPPPLLPALRRAGRAHAPPPGRTLPPAEVGIETDKVDPMQPVKEFVRAGGEAKRPHKQLAGREVCLGPPGAKAKCGAIFAKTPKVRGGAAGAASERNGACAGRLKA